MGAVFLKLLQMSVTAGYMILAVVALRVVLKKAPKWIICLLWGFVGVRLACPVSVKSVFSLIPRGETAPRGMGAAPYGAFDAGSAVVNEAAVPALSSAAAPAAADAARTDVFITAVSAVWLAGVAVMLVCALVSYMKLKRSVATAVPSKDGVMVCDEIASPFLLGLIRPTVYVPADLPEATLQNVVEHETAHFKRGDHVWKPLGYLLLAAHWFNPLCWLAYLLLCRDIEAACDEKVIRRKDKAGLAAYSQALLDCSFPRTGFSACPLAFGEVGVKQRIRSVLGYKKPAGWVLLTAAVLCAVVCVCLMTDPVAFAGSFAFPADVTEATVTHILGGQTEERRVGGETMQRLNAWLSGLRCEERAFAPGKTPGDVNGGERYVITASAPNGSAQYVYIKDENGDVWLLADGVWYAVQKPADPPAASNEAYPPAKQAFGDMIPLQPGTTVPRKTPETETTTSVSAESVSPSAEATTAPNVPAGGAAQKATGAAQTADDGGAQEQVDIISILANTPLPWLSNATDRQEQTDVRGEVIDIPPPSYPVGNGDFAEEAARFAYNSEKMNGEGQPDNYSVLEDNGDGRVTVQVGNNLYTVYGEKDYTGKWCVDSYESHADAVQGAEDDDPAVGEDD